MYFIILVDHPCTKKGRCGKNRKCIPDGDSFRCPCKRGFMDIEGLCQGKGILVWTYSASRNMSKVFTKIIESNAS